MKILVDADACPVVGLTVDAAKRYDLSCLLFCDTSHSLLYEGVETVMVDRGADAVDFVLVNRVASGDLVITQDYGLAAMCLARGANALRQDGVFYTDANMGGLLESRHFAQKVRRSGGRLRGPKKRTPEQDQAFFEALEEFLREKRQ